MPAQPNDLAYALEQALLRSMSHYHFENALSSFSNPGEKIQLTMFDGLSGSPSSDLNPCYGVEVELCEEYSGQKQTFMVTIQPMDHAPSVPLQAVA